MRSKVLSLFVVATMAVATTAVGTGSAGAAGASRPTVQPYDRILRTSIRDIQDFWSDQMPAVYGIAYAALPQSHIHAYTSKTDMESITDCARGGATYKDFKHNAFHCPLDMTINYDDQDLFPGLYKKFGAFALAQVLSHEWGHVIQTETGTEFPATILAEQQADCFAGAWAAHVDNGDSRLLKLDPGDLDKGLAGMLEFRDPVGGDPTNEGSHGSGFDRVSAFQQGFESGTQRCAQYTTDPPFIQEIPFTNALDVAQGGNLPFKDVLPTTKQDLDFYWGQFTFGGEPYKAPSDVVSYNPKDKGSLPKCSGFKASDFKDTILYCQDGDFVAYDRNLIRNVYGEFGDFAVAVLVGNAWASAMQSRLDITGDNKTIGLQADCLTGAWVGSVPVDQEGTESARGGPETRQAAFSLSPGDLDEVVQSFLVFGDPAGAKEAVRGTAFERMEAFRLGFLQDEQSCLSLTGN
ncbi:MAG TPA: neutral zinc metallopeptidase [Acidimicrobiia bacterium]|nr:neutral zinc metallopeptidase [Acidimicrobiia bacterium]